MGQDTSIAGQAPSAFFLHHHYLHGQYWPINSLCPYKPLEWRKEEEEKRHSQKGMIKKLYI